VFRAQIKRINMKNNKGIEKPGLSLADLLIQFLFLVSEKLKENIPKNYTYNI